MKLTPKQEKFCQLYIELGNASEAYRQSYNAKNMQDATITRKAADLLTNGKVTAMISELQAEHAKRHKLTVDDLLKELEEARMAALTAETVQASAAVGATMGKAKLLGFDKQVLEVSGKNGGPVQTAVAVTRESVAQIMQDVENAY